MADQTTFEQIKVAYMQLKENDATWKEMDQLLDSFPDFPKRSLVQRLSRAGIYCPKPKSSGRPLGRPPVKPGLIARIIEANPDMESERLQKMTVSDLRNVLEVLEH